ncbi:MAG: PAS domain S-box protein [Chlorobiaceae bacterium]|nr:PAS domain S-box protein [Chlorobiaceae bacterium]
MPDETDNHADFTGSGSEMSFSSLFSSLSEPVFIVDPEGIILYANAAFCTRFCRTQPECTGQNYYDLLSPELAEQRSIMVREVLRSRNPVSWDDEWEGRILRNTVYPAQLRQGEISQLLVIALDITDIGLLVKNEKVFSKSVINAIPGSFYVIDPGGKFTAWNNYIRDQVVGKHESEMGDIIGMEYIHQDDRQMMTEKIRNIIEAGDELITEARILVHGGPEFRTLLMTGSRMMINENPYLIGVGIDITERKEAEEELNRQIQHMRALKEIDNTIRGTTDIYLSLKSILECTLSELQIDAADLFLFDSNSNTFRFVAGRGFSSTTYERESIQLREGDARGVFLEQKVLHIKNLADGGKEYIPASLIESEGFVEYYAIPLIVKGYVSGLFEIFQRKPYTIKQDSLDFLHNLAGQAAMAIEDYQMIRKLHHANQDLLLAYDATIEGWSHALDLRDKETEGHTQRVTEMTVKLARAAGINDPELAHIRRGALLHDIGKMGVPDSILLKHEGLTDQESTVMSRHPAVAFELLSPIAYLHPALDIPYCHHEKWDGSGYPRGLKGEQIPYAARLFAIVDVWDALCSDRPYHKGWSQEKVLAHISSLSGKHFDPKVVELFLNLIQGSSC